MEMDVALMMLERFTDEEVRFIYAATLYILHKKEREQVHRRTVVKSLRQPLFGSDSAAKGLRHQ